MFFNNIINLRRSNVYNLYKKYKTTKITTDYDGEVIIGNIKKNIKKVKNIENIPKEYIPKDKNGNPVLPQTILYHLRWMLQKDQLGQDMFLIGRPGPLRRQIAMQYLELTKQESEYLSLSRDSTESDLKQRREIQNGSAIYLDQSAVRAASNGRVLIIEGIEKAERNVLPVINNLLENREMHLEDGRFLISSERYDKLLKDHGKEELDKWGLVRVSEDFRVIALGLPVPRYRGVPLDPPLRSRFQARDVKTLSYHELFDAIKDETKNINENNVEKLLTFGYTIITSDKVELQDFPLDNLIKLSKIMDNNNELSIKSILYRSYPYKTFLNKENILNVENLFKQLKIDDILDNTGKILNVDKLPDADYSLVKIKTNNNVCEFKVTSGGNSQVENNNEKFIETNYQSNLLSEIIQSHAVSDFCLIGPKGCGKSVLINQLALLLKQNVEQMVLYKDMTARDLIQQRTTLPNGDTIWRDSNLVKSAINGNIIVLDGLHRIHPSTISILHRLIHDRELQLFDGKKLISEQKYNDLITIDGFTEIDLTKKGILKIHNSFRIIGTGEPVQNESDTNWLTPEMLNLFLYHDIRNLSKNEEINIIKGLYSKEIFSSLNKIINLAHYLRESSDPIMKTLSTTLSTRQLLRIAKRMSIYPPPSEDNISTIKTLFSTQKSIEYIENSPYETIQRTFLSNFLPPLPRAVLEQALKVNNIYPIKERKMSDNKKINVSNKELIIGNTKMDVYQTESVVKVPDILFYDVPQHIELMEHLLQDFLIGNHLLLVGNQGVGKNKIADRLLQLMNRPREYIQLHRDTTVQTLTLQPSVQNGIIVYEDSPLVKAIKYGHILVVDEADKAPTHVTCILKTLVENNEMLLSDGRKIKSFTTPKTELSNSDDVIMHPDFRMIVLANRPGFPFLGNDFFGALGDLFSCHSVNNPSYESEIYLLQQYGKDVPKKIIEQLVNAFGELRVKADIGQLNYPYSTREVVNIVKHLQKFPDEDLSELVSNVLDFDRYTPESLDEVTSVLQKHGLNIEAYIKNEGLRIKKPIQLTVNSVSGKSLSEPKHGKVDPNNKPHVGGNTWAGGTGGRDTAGLGGIGGPYRLDAGHKVHQLSDAEKASVPEHIKQAAREMNRQAYENKLKEINMSEHNHAMYQQFSEPVQRQVKQLRVILNALQAKSKERHWSKNQTTGELDDGKLIEGIIGEKNIYRRRMDQEPEPGQPQEKPKRLKLVVDVSGSMYRFNGYDGRLDRQLEAVCMVMEAFEGFNTKVVYDIVGHSGEGYRIPFIDSKLHPVNDKERLNVIRMMHAHSQFCWSGDNTLEASNDAINLLSKEDCDEAIVIVLSDANLQRYSISPKSLSEILTKQEPKVQAYTIFIGSLGEEAIELNSAMPAGRSYICMDLDNLPHILKQIFSTSVLRSEF